MLQSRNIPQYQDSWGGEDWHRFLSKASKGSYKAVDILTIADLGLMVALSGHEDAPETMSDNEYTQLVTDIFPHTAPVKAMQQFHDVAVERNWIPHPFRVSETPRNPPEHYVALWERHSVDWTALVNDSMLLCSSQWSAEHYFKCLEEDSTEYDARTVVAGMLYLSLIWPGT